MQSLKQYQETQTGAFAAFPFGAFAFARLDERLKDEPGWRDASRQKGLDPMDMYPDQAHVEYMHINVSSLDKTPYGSTDRRNRCSRDT